MAAKERKLLAFAHLASNWAPCDQRLLTNVLVSNDDDHLRNHCFTG